MLAEIHRKISRSGSNLSDRLEDKLTGDFFGAIRYLPFEAGLRHVLRQASFETGQIQTEWNTLLDSMAGYEAELEFWPSHEEGEIDLLLHHPEACVGIEVKYFSPLSSVDEESEEPIDPEASKNQLARYARMLRERGGGRSKFLVFLAPYDILFPVKRAMEARPVMPAEVSLGYLGWQDVLAALEQIDLQPLQCWQTLVLKDLKELLVRKRFIHYKGLPLPLLLTELTATAYRYRTQAHEPKGYSWPKNQLITREDGYVYHKQ